MMNQNYMRLVHSMNRTSAWENLKSCIFDGVDEIVNIGDIAILDGVTNYSVSLWFKTSSLATSQVIMGKKLTDLTQNWNIYINTLGAIYNIMQAANGKTPSSTIAINTWYHFVATYNGGAAAANRIQLYVDGVSSLSSVTGTIPTSTTNSANDHYLGARNISNTSIDLPFTGQIDEVGIFDYTMTGAEVTALYNSGCPNDLMTLASAKRPEHYYRFDDVTYPTVDDIGQTGGNNGTMTNQESTDLVINSPCGFNNYSLAFDGVDEFTTMGTMSDLDNLTEASYSFWVKRDSATTVFPLGYFTAATSPHMYCAINSGGEVLLQMYGTGGLKAAVTTTPIATIIGGWYHIALVYDAALTPVVTALSIFVNGTKRVVTDTGATTGIPTDLGTTSAFKLAEVGSNWFDGGLDEVAVFDYALTSANVTDIYNSRVIIDLSTSSGLTSPIHWYRCGDNDTYPTISDVGSNPVNDGTMTNSESGDINESVPL